MLSPAEWQLLRVQQAVTATLLALGVLVAARLWFVEGLLRVVRIEGPSMATAFEGAHYRVTCDDCRFPFRCDAHQVPASGEVVCPNCGYKRNKLERATLQAGNQVLIDRWPHAWEAPRRGEIVAARAPDSPDDLLVKRVAALPGETLSIRGGDLYANDQLVRKSPAEWRATRVLVHDNNYQPQQTKDLPARWQASPAEGGWQTDGTGFRLHRPTMPQADKQQATASKNGAPKSAVPAALQARLEFQPWRCVEQGPRTLVVSVYDNDGYNQALHRNLNEVRDVGLSCNLELSGEVVLTLYSDAGHQRFEVELNAPAAEVRLSSDGQILTTARLPGNFAVGPQNIDWTLCDEQVLLAVAGRTVLRHAYHRPANGPVEICEPLTLSGRIANGGTIAIRDLRVWRDIYYLHPLELDRPWQADEPLPAGQYALLGDNPPVSTDSRHWPAAGIRQQAILGRVQRPFWGSQ